MTRQRKQWIALAVALKLGLISLVFFRLPVTASLPFPQPTRSALYTTVVPDQDDADWRVRIEPALLKQTMAGPADKQWAAIVVMREQTSDFRDQRSEIDGSLTQAAQRALLVEALRATSEQSQRDVRDWLAGEQAAGRVEAVRPFWIFNGLALRAQPQTIYALAARELIEELSERSLCAQTWDLYLDDWPESDGPIKLPRGPIQSVTSVKYTDSAGTETTLTVTTDYLVSTVRARIIPAYGCSWPSAILRPIDAIVVRFVAGYTTVPARYKNAILLATSGFYNHRGDDPHDMDAATMRAVKALIGPDSLGVPFA